jgi:hypothetical protein
MNGIRVRVAAVVVGGCLAARPAVAQEGTSQIRGHVTDSQAGALPGVTVTVTNQDSGTFREAVSSADGSWFMAALPPGRYQVAAQLEGFKKFLRRDVAVAVGNQVNLDLQLELGGIEETVAVTSQSPIIDVTSKEIGGNISTKELAEIPSIARTVDLNADIINVTNRGNFVNPTADRRSTNFLLLTTLYGGGQPRQAQLGLRLGF